MQKTKIIFLDVDGVLNYLHLKGDDMIKTPSGPLSRRAVRLLNHLTDITDAKLVLTSTWRKDVISATESLREGGVTGIFVGQTGWSNCSDCLRGNEIHRWMKDNTNIIGCSYSEYTDYVILDDDSDFLLWQAPHYLRVDPYCGLTPNIVYRAGRLLGQYESSRYNGINWEG